MEKETLKKKIVEVLKQPSLGSIATMKDGKPWVRRMVVTLDDDLTLVMTTFARSRKVDQIKKNNNVNCAVGGDMANLDAPYLNIQGTAEIFSDEQTKKKYWTDNLKLYFSGPDDPNFAVIKLFPHIIEYVDPRVAMQPEIYQVN